jgi:hypothetical protein
MKSLSLSTNEVFSLANVLGEARKKVHKSADGDRTAYRLDRNIATLSAIVDAVRSDLTKRVEERCNGETDEAAKAAVFKEIATAVGEEKQEVSLRTLPITGLSWSELDPQTAMPLLKLDLVEGEPE